MKVLHPSSFGRGDAVEVTPGANEKRPAGHSHGSERGSVQVVRRQPDKLPPRRNHGGRSLLAQEVDPPVGIHRRRRVVPPESLLPVGLSGQGQAYLPCGED